MSASCLLSGELTTVQGKSSFPSFFFPSTLKQRRRRPTRTMAAAAAAAEEIAGRRRSRGGPAVATATQKARETQRSGKSEGLVSCRMNANGRRWRRRRPKPWATLSIEPLVPLQPARRRLARLFLATAATATAKAAAESLQDQCACRLFRAATRALGERAPIRCT